MHRPLSSAVLKLVLITAALALVPASASPQNERPGAGTIFVMTLAGSVQTLQNISSTTLTAVDGTLYGLGGWALDSQTQLGLFALTPQGAMQPLNVLTLPLHPTGPIALDGHLYGGGDANLDNSVTGNVYDVSLSGGSPPQVRWLGNDANGVPSALVAVRGVLYGVTTGGEANCGTIFSMTTAGAVKVLHTFASHPNGYSGPVGPLVELDGTLYGVTGTDEGYGPSGTVFGVSLDGRHFRTLHRFGSGPDGVNCYPVAGLVAMGGTLYGTTPACGHANAGAVFAITPDGSERVVYDFTGLRDGAIPKAPLTAVNGMLYGTTSIGGTYGGGVAFRLTPSGHMDVLHAFGSGSDGWQPEVALLPFAGKLYGSATYGGAPGFAPKIETLRAASRSARAELTGQVTRFEGSARVYNAILSYRVGSDTATFLLGSSIADFAQAPLLVDVEGAGYPLLRVATLTHNKTDYGPGGPLFFRFNPVGPRLEALPVVQLQSSGAHDGRCTAVRALKSMDDEPHSGEIYGVLAIGHSLTIGTTFMLNAGDIAKLQHGTLHVTIPATTSADATLWTACA